MFSIFIFSNFHRASSDSVLYNQFLIVSLSINVVIAAVLRLCGTFQLCRVGILIMSEMLVEARMTRVKINLRPSQETDAPFTRTQRNRCVQHETFMKKTGGER